MSEENQSVIESKIDSVFSALNDAKDQLEKTNELLSLVLEEQRNIVQRLSNLEKGQKGIEQRLEAIEDSIGNIVGDVDKNTKDIADIKKHLSMP